jgi:hypothetical protein
MRTVIKMLIFSMRMKALPMRIVRFRYSRIVPMEGNSGEMK